MTPGGQGAGGPAVQRYRVVVSWRLHCARIGLILKCASSWVTATLQNDSHDDSTFFLRACRPVGRSCAVPTGKIGMATISIRLSNSGSSRLRLLPPIELCYTIRMILTFHEGACIRASAGDTTVVFGPVSKQSKNFKPTNFGADVAFISLNNPDMNGVEEAARGDKQPFIISGPGEYEVKDMVIAGFASGSKWKGEPRTNTIYYVHFDGMSLLYLGALGDLDLPSDVLEMDSPDVLIVPIGGDGALSPAEAQKLAVKLEAKIIIPILYDDKSLKQFLKEAGEEGTKPVDKLTIKPRDLAGKENEVVVLQS
ncbi:hypothetical protein EXS56_02060 [Candidatus Kaiserbacteria bacterium]|nr:hypothetical protein [Candidatus Kaiserbacteria bacterium]